MPIYGTSFLHGICGRDSTFRPIPLRSVPTVLSLPWQCMRYSDGQGTVQMQSSARPDYHYAWKQRSWQLLTGKQSSLRLPSSRLRCLRPFRLSSAAAAEGLTV